MKIIKVEKGNTSNGFEQIIESKRIGEFAICEYGEYIITTDDVPDDYDILDYSEVIRQIKVKVFERQSKMELEKAKRKIDYWQTVGTSILDNDELSKKWCAFVEKQANDSFARGILIDETLQILSMIKSNKSPDEIAQTIKQIPSGRTILDAYLSEFVNPDILSEIQTQFYSKKI